jgi:hypothetical protein
MSTKTIGFLLMSLILLGAGCASDITSDFDKKLSCAEQTPSFRTFLYDKDTSATEKENESPDFIKYDLNKVCYSRKNDTCIAQVLTDYDDRNGVKAHAAYIYDIFTFELLEIDNTLDLTPKEVVGVDYSSSLKMDCIY